MYKNLILSYFILLLSSQSFAQGVPSGGGGGGSSEVDTTKNFSFMPIPYISYDRSLGASFGLLPMAMYKLNKNDTVSPASISGLFGMYTTNDTWFAMFFQKFFFNQDKWRITTGGGLGSVNFQFYTQINVPPLIDTSGYLRYNTSMDFFVFRVERRLVGNLFGGVYYQYMKFNSILPGFDDFQFSDDELHGMGIILAMDQRDDVYYPINGSLSELKWVTFPELFGNTQPNNKIEAYYNHYIGMRNDKDVIATRVYGGFAIGELTFNQQFVVGQNDIRGYTQGKFRGDYTVNIQGEYRWNLHKKISLVGFAGVATVFESINEDHNGKPLPGGGVGFRYNVFPKYHMNVGMDFAVGVDDWGIYFRIGEAF